VHVRRPRWLTLYVAVLVVVDATAMGAATLLAKTSWLGLDPAELYVRSIHIPYLALGLATVPTWLVIVALAGGYDVGPFGVRDGMWKRVVRAGAQLLAVVAVSYYVLHLAMLGRGVLAAMIPLAVALTLAGRAAVGCVLVALRRRGRARRRALVLGSRRGVDSLVQQLAAHPSVGITPVGVSLVDDVGPPERPPNGADRGRDTRAGNGTGVSRGGTGHDGLDVVADLARSGADVLIVTGGLARGQLRDIAWALEGTGVELLVTPGPAELEGLRSEIRPVAGLPLLYLDR
jgi:hypothetical protein